MRKQDLDKSTLNILGQNLIFDMDAKVWIFGRLVVQAHANALLGNSVGPGKTEDLSSFTSVPVT